jgi:hypothetical protein
MIEKSLMWLRRTLDELKIVYDFDPESGHWGPRRRPVFISSHV